MAAHHRVEFPVTVQNVVHETQIVATATQNLNQLRLSKSNNEVAEVTLAFHQPLVQATNAAVEDSPWNRVRLNFDHQSTDLTRVGISVRLKGGRGPGEPAIWRATDVQPTQQNPYFEFQPTQEGNNPQGNRYPVSIEIKVSLREGASAITLTGLDLWHDADPPEPQQ